MPGKQGTPERFLTTVLMTDIVGSTEHAAELGDRAWRDLIAQHHAVVRAALRRHGGRELDTAGDGFFAIFDAPANAVSCALEIADEVKQLGVEVRVGIHVGEVEQAGRKVGGISVPIASRIMSIAEPSEVLVSSTVRDLVTGSGLKFEDRGVRELKGVPGEWHVYAVGRAETEAIDTGAAVIARERRAAAVRRAASRPIWQRRPRLVAAVVVGLAIVVATAGLLVWKPWQGPALAGVEVDSIGVIDPDRNEFTGEIRVGKQPGGIVVADGYAWVTNTGADSVSQIDVATREVINRDIAVGHSPKGIAAAAGLVWVANSGARTVSRINMDTSRGVGEPIEVGNGPTAIASIGNTLWVANATDSTVVSIDAATGVVGQPVGVGAAPIALAVDDGGLWVASEDAATVIHLDPVTGVSAAAPIQLAARPTALALDPESVWVTSVDGTITRIERSTNRITPSIPIGASLSGIAVSGSAIWTGDQNGVVYRIDAGTPTSPPQLIATNTAIGSLAVVDGDLWFAAQPSTASRRGGTLRIVNWFEDGGRFDTDPLLNPYVNPALVEADGLVGYRRVGGSAGSALLADLATSVPQPTNVGLTYTFYLRPNLEYSTGEAVRASDFRRGIERSFQVRGWSDQIWGAILFSAIQGADACSLNYPEPVNPCDLSAGIVADDVANSVTFNLSKPDADFVYKLAHPAAYPVPEGVPMDRLLDGEAFPGTGPYVVSTVTANEVRLTRNPRFHSWDAAVRPDGFPDEIVFTVLAGESEPISMVERGDADLVSCCFTVSPSDRTRFKAQYAGQLHVGSIGTTYVEMNTSIAPFNDVSARKAVNFAIDRGQIAEIAGGPPDIVATCQFLPPGFPAYRPYCPYTTGPDEGDHWKAPDMQEAQKLVDASGTGGAQITFGDTGRVLLRDYLVTVLEELGYEVSIDDGSVSDEPIHINIGAWASDYLAPSGFLTLFTCNDEQTLINYCNTAFDAAFDHALELQAIDPPAALSAWTELDHRAVDLALMAPMFNGTSYFVSDRVGNFQFNPAYAVLFDQMWVQ